MSRRPVSTLSRLARGAALMGALALLLCATAATAQAQAKTALLVVNSTTLTASDSAIRTRLQNLGFTVTVVSGLASTTADASGKTLVYISSTVASADVNTKFRTVAVPVITSETALYDDMGMTGPTDGTDFGVLATQTQVSILDSTHPLAAGLSGTVTVTSSTQEMAWGVPNANAAKIASLTSNSARVTIFGYLSGAAMPGLTAPARRVGLFLRDTSAQALTASGGQLFDAAVNWVTPKTWDGGAGTNNWGDANNWSPDGVPTSSDILDLTGANTININVAAAVSNLTLNNAGLTLTILTGNSLTVSGNLTLTSGALNKGTTTTLNIAGNLAISAGATFQKGTGTTNFNGTSTTITDNTTSLQDLGDVTVASTKSVSLSTSAKMTTLGGAGAITLNATTLRLLGSGTVLSITTFTASANSTTEFACSGNCAVPAITYHHLTINSAGSTATLNGTFGGTVINGNLVVQAGTFSRNGSSCGGFGCAVTIKGNITANAGTTLGGEIAAYTFAGASQSVTLASPTTQDLGNITVGTSSTNPTVTLSTDVQSAWGLTIGTTTASTGTLNLNGKKLTVCCGNVTVNTGGTFLHNNGTFEVDGGFGPRTISDNTGTQNFGNLIVGLTGNTVNLATNIKAQTVTVSGGTFGLGTYNLDVGTDAGTGSITGTGTLSASSPSVTTLRGAGNLGGGAFTFHGLQLIGNGTTTTLTGDITVNDNLTLGNGTNAATFDLGSFTANRASAGGSLTVNNGATLKIGGTNTIPANYSAHSIGATSTIEYSGTNQSFAVLNSSQDYANLTVSGSGTKTLAGSLNVGGTLTFSGGTITTGANTLYLKSTGSVTRSSGHVIGNFRKNIATGATSKTFEVGVTNYTPVTVAFASVTTAGDLTVVAVSGHHPNIGTSTIDPLQSMNRYWTLTNSGIVFTNYNATFTFVAGVVDAGADPNAFIVGKYSGGTWTYPTVGTKTATSTQATGLTAFSDFQVGEGATLFSISGTVFEDKNYGGSAGRSLVSSSGVARPGARVELFDSGGTYQTFTTTDSSGNYIFSSLGAGTYTVRVVNSSVTSSRGGTSLLPVQTFRTNASSGTAVAVTDLVGGETPSLADAGNGSTTLAALTTGTTTAQSITSAVLSSSNITGVDFGYSFNVIVNKNDSGQGSLRQFLANANALSNTGLAQSGLTAGIDNAVFMLADGTTRPGLNNGYASQFTSGVATIALASSFPTISDPIVIDATLQPGHAGVPMIELNGAGAGAGVSGLTITAGSSTVKGLVINRFTVDGISLSSGGSNTIAGNYLGTNAAGTAASANASAGIKVTSANNTIGGTTAAARNLLAGNTVAGLTIDGGDNNTIVGNYFGTNAAGTAAVINGSAALYLLNGANNNTIGGTAAGTRNVISGSNIFGVIFSGSTGNSALGNYVGTNAAGTGAISAGTGFYIIGGATNNTIGGTTAAARNIISGNFGYGVYMTDAGTSGNVVQGNYIGLNAAGTAALPNAINGVTLIAGANNNTIGGTASGAGNVISGNTTYGISIDGSTTTGNLVQGNFVGTNPAGSAAIANQTGVFVTNGANNNAIGGTASGARNVISGNTFSGVSLNGGTVSGNLVQGNYLGLNAAGTGALPNGTLGVWIAGAVNNTVGGTTATARNIISGNGLYGIVVQYAGTSGNLVQGNYIGTNPAGTAAMANGGIGVYVLNSATNNTIGGTAAGARNVISGNASHGIAMDGTGVTGNFVQGNYIGTNATATAAIANAANGVHIFNGAANNTLGGTGPGAGNIISGNGGKGVVIITGTGNAILSNSIYGNAGIGIDLTDNGVTANDGTKSGALANSGMDAPVFSTVTLAGTTLTVSGYVGSAAGQAAFAGASVQVFKSDNDASGFGEGATLIGTLTSDANGNFSGTLTVSLAVGDKITGTATDGSNNTSEFGANATVAYPPPNVALINSVTPSGTQAPGTDLVFTVAFTNDGGQPAQVFIVVDPIPANTDFKLGSPSTDLGTTGMTVTVEYSNDNASTWTYTPVSGGGGALPGYDRTVTHVRWRFAGTLSQTSPNNTGNVGLTARIR